MIPGSKGLKPPVLAQRWCNGLGTRPNMSIKVERKLHDMRIVGRIVGVHCTKQSVGILVGGFCPQHQNIQYSYDIIYRAVKNENFLEIFRKLSFSQPFFRSPK